VAKTASQTVQGEGFQFAAPPGWVVTRESNATSAGSGPVDRVEVLRFTLVKPYRRPLFQKAARELDAVIARLAKQLRGRVVRRATVQLAGAPARSYRIDYGAAKTQEIAFVLRGTSEYELLCRRPTSGAAAPCQQLLQSFVLTDSTSG
jgi:hypothetical protein